LKKFQFFTRNISRMDELFQATFTSLATSGKRVSKCGICHGTMTYITTRPSRLYCETCEAVYRVPQGGTIKLYKELVCPLDGFELVLFTVDGPDGRAYPLCPYCFSHPPFEGVTKVWGGAGSGGMPCTNCTHPSCPHSLLQLGVCSGGVGAR
jgi:DNA topoisomerase-3